MKASTVSLALALLGASCTAKNPAYDKQLARLNESVTILQHERDRLEERIAVLETERDTTEARPKAPGTLERPPLKVVQLEPPSDTATTEPAAQSAVEESAGAGPDAPAGDGERVLIHGTGTELQNSPVAGAE
jgi:hypothetical protein